MLYDCRVFKHSYFIFKPDSLGVGPMSTLCLLSPNDSIIVVFKYPKPVWPLSSVNRSKHGQRAHQKLKVFSSMPSFYFSLGSFVSPLFMCVA